MKPLIIFALIYFSVSATLMAQQPIKIASVGNSITQGPGQTHEDSYPMQLQVMLGDNYLVQNFGVSGRTLLKKGDFPYWNEPEMERVKDFQPDILLVKLGTNDSKPQNWQYKDEFKQDYLDLIKEFKGSLSETGRIIILIPVPVTEDNFGIRESVMVEEMRPILLQIIEESSLEMIDLYTPLQGRGDLLPDGVHPNKEGLGIMAKTVYDYLTKK
ncbi:GDSL-type esterase/lipase family protein [Mongoliitalea daihaiensis]|uniref:GDSL-type esterase/lipase family protein n=1 Tax=Mongoliitalea daihaiensis TaxID=2782006 RepID=UPI001F2C6DD4|nr:GDSL-type esterase/lipase family protein [Mongoliitalea daihaiensis]UJP66176.1 sialate O-acetylesterase [Mongoliitalea daihaiensis]